MIICVKIQKLTQNVHQIPKLILILKDIYDRYLTAFLLTLPRYRKNK